MAFIFKKNKEKKVKISTTSKENPKQNKPQDLTKNVTTYGTLLDFINKK